MLKKLIRPIVGIFLAYGLIYLTLKSTGGDIWNELLRAKKPLLILALFMHGIIIGLAIYRWNLLLKVQLVYLKVWDLIQLTTIGIFFNLMIPGAVGGDLVKMAFLGRQVKEKTTEAILTIILDRMLGLLGLFLVASVSVLFFLPFLLHLGSQYRFIQISAFIVGLGSFAGIFGIILIEFRHIFMNYSLVERIIRYTERMLPLLLVSLIKRIVAALELYRKHRGTIVVSISLSVLIHSCYAFNFFIVSRSVGESILGLQDYFLAVPVANAVAAIPLTPGGIGTRDAVIAIFLKSMQASSEIVGIVPIVMTIVILFWGLVGGIVLLFYKNSRSVIESKSSLNERESSLPIEPVV